MASETTQKELLDALDERRTIEAAGGDLGPIDRKIGEILARQPRRPMKAADIEEVRRRKGFDPMYAAL